MSAAFGLFIQVLPLAIGAAMSPTFLAIQILVLTSEAPGALRRGWALALGSMSMLLLISFGGFSLLDYLPRIKISESWSLVVLLVLASVVLMFVSRHEARRPPGHKAGKLDKALDASPIVIFGVGALRLLINASTLALYLPALHIISNADVNIATKAVAFLLLFLITELAVLAPVLSVTLLGDRAKPTLLKIHDGIDHWSKPVMVWTCRVFAVVLLLLAAWYAWQLR